MPILSVEEMLWSHYEQRWWETKFPCNNCSGRYVILYGKSYSRPMMSLAWWNLDLLVSKLFYAGCRLFSDYTNTGSLISRKSLKPTTRFDAFIYISLINTPIKQLRNCRNFVTLIQYLLKAFNRTVCLSPVTGEKS